MRRTPEPVLLRVPTAEFTRNIEHCQDGARREPLAVIKGENQRCVVLSTDEYVRLNQRDQRVITVDKMTEEDINLIATSTMPSGYEHLDAELDGWEP